MRENYISLRIILFRVFASISNVDALRLAVKDIFIEDCLIYMILESVLQRLQ